MGLFGIIKDKYEKEKSKFKINRNLDRVTNYINRVNLETDTAEFVSEPTPALLEIVNDIRRYRVMYDNHENYKYRDIIYNFDAACRSCQKHNEKISLLFDAILKFDSYYQKVINNPEIHNIFNLAEYTDNFHYAETFRPENRRESVNIFIKEFIALRDNIDEIKEQFGRYNLVLGLFNEDYEYYIDDKTYENLVNVFNSLVLECSGYLYYDFPSLNQYKEKLNKNNDVYIANVQPLIDYNAYCEAYYEKFKIITINPQGLIEATNFANEYIKTHSEGNAFFEELLIKYKESFAKIKEHNQLIESSSAIAKEFEEVYFSVIDNPSSFNKLDLNRFLKTYKAIESLYQKPSYIIKFGNNLLDVYNNFDVIKEQFSRYKLAIELLNKDYENYIDDKAYDNLVKGFSNLILECPEDSYYDFPSLKQYEEKLNENNKKYLDKVQSLIDFNLYCKTIYNKFEKISINQQGLIEAVSYANEYINTHTIGSEYFQNLVSEYENNIFLIEEHNKIIESSLNMIYEFEEVYKKFFDNPLMFISSDFDAFIDVYNSVNTYSNKPDSLISFERKLLDICNNIEEIQSQYVSSKKVLEILEINEDCFFDEECRNIIINNVKDLLPKKSVKKYYSFPSIREVTSLLEIHNNDYINKHIKDSIFDDINGLSLDEEQRRAILCEEKNNLVIAGAGSGKTLTICGKTKYLIEKLNVSPEDILLLSFSRASTDDLANKIKNISEDIEVNTFHKLGLRILRKDENNDKIIETQFNQFVENYIINQMDCDSYIFGKVINYFGLFLYDNNQEKFEIKGDLYHNLKNKDFRTIKDRITHLSHDGRTTINREIVKSNEEMVIANYYYLNGVDYEYEKPYEHSTYTNEFSQYRPDFYLSKYKVYHEHYGLNENDECTHFTAEEARKYEEGVEWKRKTHYENDTDCIETYSYQFSDGSIFKYIDEQWRIRGIVPKPRSYREIWNKLKITNSNGYVRSFVRLVTTFLSLYKSRYKDDTMFDILKDYQFDSVYENQRAVEFLDICKVIYNAYKKSMVYSTQEDENNEKIDFDDMILKSIDKIDSLDSFRYKYIIVDEFQDISYSRISFLKKLVEHGNSKLFVVGDDWQSIYRFSGSDIDIFINLDKYIGKVYRNFINTTYRNSVEINRIAEKFIIKNDEQIKKKILSNKHEDKPIKIMEFNEDKIYAFKRTLELISNEKNDANILILGRNNFDLDAVLPSEGAIKDKYNNIFFTDFPNLNIRFSTVHSSKGLEEEYVILINGDEDKVGFPNMMEDDKLLSLVLSNKSDYPYAEERRLFYVALTRTKGACYILVNAEKPSIFIKEIRDDCDIIESKPNPRKYDDRYCPNCKTGKLIEKNNSYDQSSFYGCTNFPYCRYTESK